MVIFHRTRQFRSMFFNVPGMIVQWKGTFMPVTISPGHYRTGLARVEAFLRGTTMTRGDLTSLRNPRSVRVAARDIRRTVFYVVRIYANDRWNWCKRTDDQRGKLRATFNDNGQTISTQQSSMLRMCPLSVVSIHRRNPWVMSPVIEGKADPLSVAHTRTQ